MLLLTDRLSTASRLKQVLGDVEHCVVLSPGQGSGPSGDHSVILVDLALEAPAALAAAQAVLAHHRPGPPVPVLHLSRQAGEAAMTQGQAIGATAVLPHDASDAQILFTVRRLAESWRVTRRRAAPAAAPAVAAHVQEAGAAFADLFDASRRGRPLTAADLEQGANAVMAAVAAGRIGVWLDVVRAYDDITYQHCLLVAGLAAAFSVRLGMTMKGQRLIAQAALVHDIGKAHVPLAILNKAGPLSASEMALMRLHPAAGHDMLTRQGGFDPQLLDIVRHHHEYVDGSGYPDGLRGDEISALVRLVTICDIYAAMIERRSYKPARPPDVAFAVLVDMGSKLDVGLVKVFQSVIGEA